MGGVCGWKPRARSLLAGGMCSVNTSVACGDRREKRGCVMSVLRIIKKVIKVFIPYGIIVIRQKAIRLKRRKLLRFDIHLTDHCNLNCKGCEHFSPIAEKKFLDIKKYEQDCIRLNTLTGGSIDDISLLGGEPLLHPQIIDFMVLTRKYFPSGMIRIITNGLLLEKQPDIFWEACKKNDITIFISIYPVKINYFYIKAKTDTYGIKLVFWGDPINESKVWRKLRIDLRGRQNPWISNFYCYGSNQCFQLVDGKLFKCWRVAYIHYFNRTFGKELKISPRDYVDIYKENDINKILDRLRKPAPFCRYCDMIRPINTEWQQSKKEIEEWI
jgi:sulfatase maturation enzyme AslB (radical SAM superfamily)